MKPITKIILILVIFFITSILTTIVKEIDLPYLVIIPPLVGFLLFIKYLKNRRIWVLGNTGL